MKAARPPQGVQRHLVRLMNILLILHTELLTKHSSVLLPDAMAQVSKVYMLSKAIPGVNEV